MKTNSFYPVLMTDEVKKCADFFIKYFDFKLTFQMDWYISLIDENNIELAFTTSTNLFQVDISFLIQACC